MLSDSIPPIGASDNTPEPGPIGPSPDSGGQSPFRKMFGNYPMSDEQFRQFINQFLKDMISQFKESDAQWKKAQDQLKKAMEGKQ